MHRRPAVCHCHKPPTLCACPNNWAYCDRVGPKGKCGMAITWTKTELEKNMPIDGHHRVVDYDPKYHRSHFVTCKARARKPKPRPPQENPNQLNLFAEMAIQEIRATKARMQGS